MGNKKSHLEKFKSLLKECKADFDEQIDRFGMIELTILDGDKVVQLYFGKDGSYSGITEAYSV